MGDPTGSYIIHATADQAVGQLLAALDWRQGLRTSGDRVAVPAGRAEGGETAAGMFEHPAARVHLMLKQRSAGSVAHRDAVV